METNYPSAGIKVLCKDLGDKYSIRVIDNENVIYRDFGECELEVSGADSDRKVHYNFNIYIWSKNPREIVERSENIKSINQLKFILADISKRY